MKQPEAAAGRYMLYFNESLRGLSTGAPVTILGLPAGEVADVGFDVDPKTAALLGRVEVVACPERLIAHLRVTPSGAQHRVACDVQKLESAPGKAATLDALWALRRTKDDKVLSGRTTVREPSTQQGFDALASVHSRDIAEAVRALEQRGS